MNKPRMCVDHPDRPVRQPSLVLCAECFDRLDKQFTALTARPAWLDSPAAHARAREEFNAVGMFCGEDDDD